MHDGSLYCAPCAISTSTNDKNPSPVQESILACTGKGRTCKCDSCAASRREKAKIQKRNSRARKKLQLQNDVAERGKCQTMGACDCIQHAVQTQNAINAEKKAEHRFGIKSKHDDHLASHGVCEALDPSKCGCPQHQYINALKDASRRMVEHRSVLVYIFALTDIGLTVSDLVLCAIIRCICII